MSRTFKTLLASSLLCFNAYAQTEGEVITPFDPSELLEEQPPNVILLMTDDLGYGDIGFKGNKWIDTPNFNKLAEESIRWKTFYVSPVGSLTRASTFTGRYNIRTKVIDTSLGRSMMASDEITLAEALSGAGYKTGIFGKWHLGDHFPMRPSDQGFDTSLVFRGGGLGQPSDPIENQGRYTNPILFKNDSEISTVGYSTNVFFDAAKKFIAEANENQQPFFATIAVNVPHAPYSDVPESLLKKYQAKDLSAWSKDTDKDTLARIAAMVDNLDQNLGELDAFLNSQKLNNNTIIVFCSDNGPDSLRFNRELRGKKGDIYEGGIRSPFWIKWPEKFKKGREVIDNVAGHIDIMPTILDACELGTPEAFQFDGRSLLPQILEPGKILPERPLVIQWHNGATPIKHHHFMVRQGKWKLLNPSNPQESRLESRNFELYDIDNDPGETTNLIEQHEDKSVELLNIYNTWLDDVTETRIRDRGTPYILVDRENENPLVLTWQDRISKAWGYQEEGFWKTHFEHSGRCDMRIEFPLDFDRDLTGWTARLTIGREIYTQKVNESAQGMTFTGLNFNKGKHLVRAAFISPDQSELVGAYQVRLIHR
ncbi:arylsulfatase [Rubritalea spongiae]|uniref:Arylsulfatase n=1 Tax=Rubritalea spongiae TaxID=430797 RepID=A0ABW5E4J0_9BACT